MVRAGLLTGGRETASKQAAAASWNYGGQETVCKRYRDYNECQETVLEHEATRRPHLSITEITLRHEAHNHPHGTVSNRQRACRILRDIHNQ